ncbi:hypothetical protein BP00DRAFT_429048 [Aspergillus indologenus CBS 114.80]|uniref:Uncharacterized protein n=1 Tax=Aspergillus indologenus CBS 114.80 TaxID=1450541 RepID=A0A2V5HTE0_9EURO|nr:hypothetical protein BP00DRAFT_429048 [Aspergillus indologenus CBS 114.80]
MTLKTYNDSPQRLDRRKFLVDLESKIETLQAHKLGLPQLKELMVEIQGMSLNGATSRKPFFFVPRSDLPEPDEERIKYLQWVFDLDEQDTCFTSPSDRARQFEVSWTRYTLRRAYDEAARNRPWSKKCVGDYMYWKTVYECTQPEFGVFHMTDMPGRGFPHMMAVIYNDLEVENQEILRGELLIILRMMIGQFRLRRLLGHMIIPVMIISFMGKSARAIEAYFDGERLILGCTDLYSTRHQTATALKDLGGLYLGTPIGDTA